MTTTLCEITWLDADVTRYLPDFKPENPSGKAITLRQLMTHRAGLVRESPVGNYFDPTTPTLAATGFGLSRLTFLARFGPRRSTGALALAAGTATRLVGVV